MIVIINNGYLRDASIHIQSKAKGQVDIIAIIKFQIMHAYLLQQQIRENIYSEYYK